MLEAARAASEILALINKNVWAKTFVGLRIAFFRKFGRGLVCSTQHGVDYFDHVVACCEGRLIWSKDVEKGEYGDNFRKMIAERPRT
jgi:hypothetical protein